MRAMLAGPQRRRDIIARNSIASQVASSIDLSAAAVEVRCGNQSTIPSYGGEGTGCKMHQDVARTLSGRHGGNGLYHGVNNEYNEFK